SPEERAVYDRIVESPLGTEKYILLRLAATDARLVDPRTYRGSRSVQEKLREIFPGEEDFFGRLGDPSRYRELDRQVERALADGGKVVIFSQFREGIIDELAVRYGRFGVARIDGSVSSEPSGVFSPRDVQRLEFQTCPEIRIMIATRGSLREGHDLHAANRVICLHQDISPGYNDQALGRVARKGQLRPVHATTLVADGTIDRGVQMMELEKRGAIRMVDKGLSLTPEQRELLQRGGMETPQLRDYLMNPHIMLKRMIGHMTGRGGSWNSSYLAIGGNARLYADAYAYQWETSYSGQTARLVRALISDLDPALSDVSAIIDLASGPAIVTRVTGIKSTCVDLNRYQLEYGKRQAARRGIAVDAFIGDVEDLQSLGIPDGRFDLAVLSLALHYGTREGGRKRMVLEANRVLRPGGSFILTVPDGYVDRGEIGQLERGLEALGFSPVEGRHGIARALDSTDRDFSVYAALCTKAADPPRGVASNSLYDDLFALRRQTAISLPSPARQAPPPAPPRKDICSLFQFEDGDVIGNPGAGAAARVETVLPPDKEQLVAPPNALVESPELVLQHLRRLTNKGRRDHDS
ncbi:MAG: methyltransferase domain-containing protein, partial [Candidatus Aenigmarchaeota archaeon]|nr:methyltransferase domain-containing protein [Candidatus Aenigmarchaeota archaeon]